MPQPPTRRRMLAIAAAASGLPLPGRGAASGGVPTVTWTGQVLGGVGSITLCHPDQAAAEAIKMPSPIHLNTVQGYFPRILTALQEKLAAIEEVHRANNINKITLEKTAIESDGMVL